jgi:hypothetical protein
MTDTTGETPRYKLLADAFFAPRMLKAGSIIATHASPGNHMEPLNEAAEARMEEWYNEKHPVVGKDGKATGEHHHPHAKYKIQRYEPGEVHHVELLAEPKPQDMTDSLSLAEVDQVRYKDTDQRPGPEQVPEAEAIREQTGAEVIEAAKETDARKAGVKVT